jgi:hypothetical protein
MLMKKILLFSIQIFFTVSIFSASSKKGKLVIDLGDIKYSFVNLSDTSFRIIRSPANTYGYEILIGKKVFIRQLNVPGKSGLTGFKNEKDAKKIALLVITKLSQRIIPPRISEQELQKLKINF